MKIVLVAAVADNNVIGANGGMPWRLRSDLAHFRRVTLNKPVIMGRKTFESIGKPLKDRTNIVITRDAGRSAPGIIFVPSFEDALAAARSDAEKRGTDEIMVIGGSDVFRAAMPLAHRLEITHVHASPAGNVYFPPIDAAVWRQVSCSDHVAGEHDSADFTVSAYLRR
jgi:dihydrofolate reductase